MINTIILLPREKIEMDSLQGWSGNFVESYLYPETQGGVIRSYDKSGDAIYIYFDSKSFYQHGESYDSFALDDGDLLHFDAYANNTSLNDYLG